MGRALDSHREPVSPELVLVDPELRMRLALEVWRAEVEAEARPEPPRRGRWLRLVGAGAVAYSILVPGAVALAERPQALPPPLVLTPVSETLGLGDSRPAAAVHDATAPRPPDAMPRPFPHPRPPRRFETHETEPAAEMLGPLPDPTPPRLRLRATTARALLAQGGDWAAQLAHGNAAAAAYERAVGIDALVSGLDGARRVLAARVLRDPRIDVYPAGRGDIATGRVDVRVLALLLTLARTEGRVAVSSLVSGHAPTLGGPSAHAYGAAVDIRALGGAPVFGNPARVRRAIDVMQSLPTQVRPRVIVSAAGGLRVAGHDRTIHVGYDPAPAGRLELLWRTAGAAYGVPWPLLAAINEIETNNGALLAVSPAGAVGWMQFMPSTWSRYGVDADGNGIADPWEPTDAIFAAARYLAAAGVGHDQYRAVWAYNHADWYVNDVLARARRIAAAG